MATDGPELISLSIANRSAGTVARTIEIETRKPADAFANRIVERSGKTERGQVHPILTFRRVRSANEPIETVPEIQHGVGVECVNFVYHSLSGLEDKPVSDVNRIGVVVVGALPVIPTVTTKQFVFVADALVKADGVIAVRRVEKFGKRRVSNVVVEKKITLCSVFGCAPECHHGLGYRTDSGIGNFVAAELCTVSNVAA